MMLYYDRGSDSEEVFLLGGFNRLDIVDPPEVEFLEGNISYLVDIVDENVAGRELFDLLLEVVRAFDFGEEEQHVRVLLVRVVVHMRINLEW